MGESSSSILVYGMEVGGGSWGSYRPDMSTLMLAGSYPPRMGGSGPVAREVALLEEFKVEILTKAEVGKPVVEVKFEDDDGDDR